MKFELFIAVTVFLVMISCSLVDGYVSLFTLLLMPSKHR